MWSTFVNEPLKQYNRNVYEKFWLINQFDVDSDIKNTIRNDERWFIKEFRIPDENDSCINEYGIFFHKIPIGLHMKHNHRNKEVLMTLINGKIIDVKIFLIADLSHYYNIDFEKSGIHDIKIIKQHYKIFKRDGGVYVTTIDPIFRAK